MATGTKKRAARTQPATWFARRLREARERAGLTQTELGLRIGIDPSAASPRMNQYEKGLHEPPHALTKRMAEELDVPLAYFFTESDERLAELLAAWNALDARSRKALAELATSEVPFADLASVWVELEAKDRRAILLAAKKKRASGGP